MISQKTIGASHIKTDRVGSSNNDPFERQSAEAKEAFGGKDIGTVLNEIADPNWVDPKMKREVGSNTLDKDAFMKLMLEQMKHQDPTNPMESHQMAAQLAQFTSLEQLQNMNSGMNKLVEAQKPNEKFQALSMIGKVVSSDSSKISHTSDKEEHGIRFNLKGDAKEVEVAVSNNKGEKIRTYQFHNLKEGQNNVSWNARDDDGFKLPPGDYMVTINAKNDKGGTVIADTKMSGKITGVNFSGQGPVLIVGNQSIKLQDVKNIEDPSVMEQDQSKNTNDITKMDLKKGDEKADNEKGMREGNLDQVAMQKSLKEQLDKANGNKDQ